jgi:hypothetical protein
MSRDRYTLLFDVTARVAEQRSMGGHKANTSTVLLAVCVLRALPRKGFTCHNMNTTFKEFHLALYIFFVNPLINLFQNIGCYDLMKLVQI